MLFTEIEKYLRHTERCEYDNEGLKPVCDCGLEEMKKKLRWTHGMPCSVEGCEKVAADCGKCGDHCTCTFPSVDGNDDED